MLTCMASSLLPCSVPSPQTASVPPLRVFITQLILQARIKSSAILTCFYYLSLLKKVLPHSAQGNKLIDFFL